MGSESVRQHADALVREYLARNGLKQTLEALDVERPRDEHTLSSRSATARGLKLERLVKRNKEREPALGSLLEMVVEALLLNERHLRVDAREPAGPDAGSAAVVPPPHVQPPPPPAASASMAAADRLRPASAAPTDGRHARHVAEGHGDLGTGATPRGGVLSDGYAPHQPAPPRAAPCAGPPDATSSASVRTDWGTQHARAAGSGTGRATALSGTLLVEEDFDEDVDGADVVPARRIGTLADSPTPSAALSAGVRGALRQSELGARAAEALSTLFHGRAGAEWMASWVRQGFGFTSVRALPFGLYQHRGGTCGVIAAVQALTLREMCLPGSVAGVASGAAAVNPLHATPPERDEALARAISGALWRIAEEASAAAPRACLVQFPGRMVLPPAREMGREASVLEFDTLADLQACVRDRLPYLQMPDGAGVVAFAFSCVMSAGGPDRVREHMDNTGAPCTLLGAHGYCTQELVNLVLVGRACSNVFDGVQDLDGMKMHGVTRRSPVGLLSLFEHYGHVIVGENLKSPSIPVWLCFMESHYTVVFSPNALPNTPSAAFDLYYYDMLANQDEVIRLTVDPSKPQAEYHGNDLVPPLEHTLHTKWSGAHVSWNGTDPLL